MFKRHLLLISVLVLTVNSLIAWSDEKWDTAKSKHFIVYYKNAESDFIDKIIDTSEDYYDKITDELGLRRKSYDFWLWDNRAKIYIYDDAQEYQRATGNPVWSSGAAVPKTKIIHTFVDANHFFDRILPHELGHIIFREFVGFDNYAVPYWLDEGTALYTEKFKHSNADILVKRALDSGTFMPIEKLSRTQLYLISDPALAQLFYAEAISLVNFLIKKSGKDDFVMFCEKLRDKKDLKKALKRVYAFSGISELEEEWQKYLK